MKKRLKRHNEVFPLTAIKSMDNEIKLLRADVNDIKSILQNYIDEEYAEIVIKPTFATIENTLFEIENNYINYNKNPFGTLI